MDSGKCESLVLAIKDAQSEHSIPAAWRPVIHRIVNAFVRQDYQLEAAVPGVVAVSAEMARKIRSYIQDYGAELIELSEDTWNSSVCSWMGDRWDALIDLCVDADRKLTR